MIRWNYIPQIVARGGQVCPSEDEEERKKKGRGRIRR
jgi:hypothetical protein